MPFSHRNRIYLSAIALVALLASFVIKTQAQTPTPTTATGHLALGNPSGATNNTSNPDNYLMEKSQYVLSYNRTKGIPNWVSWQINSSWLGSAPRQNNFRADPTLPTGWYPVKAGDYTYSSYDRGHMAPSGDRTNTTENNSSTFVMTNILPQAPDNNQGYWADLEDYSRDLVTQQGKEVYVISGSYGQIGSIAGGKVAIPERLYKIVVVTTPGTGAGGINESTRLIAIDTPNTNGNRTADWRTYITTVDAIESKTGYDFLSNVNPAIQTVIEAKTDTGVAAQP